MKVVAFGNQKGGVAKTTTALSVAAHIAGRGHRTLAIDLDPQANLTLGLGVNPEDVARSSHDLLAGEARIADVVRETGVPNLALVPSEIRLAMAERTLQGEVGFDEVLRARLREVADGYDYVLLDCPPSLGVLTLNALSAASVIVVPVQCEFFSAKGLVQLLDVVQAVRARRNPDLDVRVLPTLYDGRNGICRGILDQIRRRFAREAFETVIGIDTKLREAAARGRPITEYAPRSRGCEQYGQLTEELLHHAQN